MHLLIHNCIIQCIYIYIYTFIYTYPHVGQCQYTHAGLDSDFGPENHMAWPTWPGRRICTPLIRAEKVSSIRRKAAWQSWQCSWNDGYLPWLELDMCIFVYTYIQRERDG